MSQQSRPERAVLRGGWRSVMVLAAGVVVGGAVMIGGRSAVLPAVVIIVCAVVHRRARRRRLVAGRAARDAAALPPSIELCAVVLGAGGTIPDCLRALAANGPLDVSRAAASALDLSENGATFDDALRAWRSALGPGFQPLTGALLLAWERGGAVGAWLDRLAVAAATARRRQGDLRARRLPVALLLPLVMCSLPAVVIGALVPLALVSFGRITP